MATYELKINDDLKWLSAQFRAQPEGDDGVIVIDGDHAYLEEVEVEFKINRVTVDATFVGTWYVVDRSRSWTSGGNINTTYTLSRDETPAAVFTAMVEDFSDRLIDDIRFLGEDGRQTFLGSLEFSLLIGNQSRRANEMLKMSDLIYKDLAEADDLTTARNILLDYRIAADKEGKLIDLAKPLDPGGELKKWKTIDIQDPRRDYNTAKIGCRWLDDKQELHEFTAGADGETIWVRDPTHSILVANVEIQLQRKRLVVGSQTGTMTLDLNPDIQLYEDYKLPLDLGVCRLVGVGHSFTSGKAPSTDISFFWEAEQIGGEE